jgi:DNA-binding transcriptional LysR family regulator
MNTSRLTLRQLQIFVAIADRGGTTAGAGALALSQSATSAALIELEGVLGTQLFDRVGKRLILNDHGRSLLPNARSVLQSTAAIAAQFGAHGEPTAYNLRVSASTTIANYILPAVIARFYALHPATQVEIDVGNTSDVIAAVEAFDADVGFIEGPCLKTSITVIPWMLDELVVVCAPSHPLASGTRQRTVSLQALRESRWLFREPGSGTREAVEHALLPHLHHLRLHMQLGSAEAIRQAVAEGLGVTCLSRHIVEDMLRLGRLVQLKTALPKLQRHFSLIHQRDKYLTSSLKLFNAFCLNASAKHAMPSRIREGGRSSAGVPGGQRSNRLPRSAVPAVRARRAPK